MSIAVPRPRRAALALASVLAVGLAAGLTVGAAPTLAAPTYTVSGVVSVEGGEAADGAYVAVIDENGATTDDAMADASGLYTLSAEAGTYTLYGFVNVNGTSFYSRLAVTIGSSAVTRNVVLVQDYACANVIAGSPYAGRTLAAQDTVSPSGDPFQYVHQVWVRYTVDAGGMPTDVTPIPGAAGSTYLLTDADVGHRIAYYADIYSPATSRAGSCSSVDGVLEPVVGGRLPAPVGALSVVGKAKVGRTLSAVTGSLPAGVTATYQWYRVVKVRKHHRTVVTPIAGATGATYRLRKKDRGAKVFVQGTYSGGGYTPVVVGSAPRKVTR